MGSVVNSRQSGRRLVVASSDHAVPCYQLQTRAASKRRNTICFMRYYSRE